MLEAHRLNKDIQATIEGFKEIIRRQNIERVLLQIKLNRYEEKYGKLEETD